MEDEKLKRIYIPPNVNNSHKFAQRIRWRNLLEAVAWTIILGYIILFKTVFLFKVKIIFLICFVFPIAILNIIGIKNRSISEFIMAYINNKVKAQTLHLRSVSDERSTKSKIFTNIPVPTDESGSLFDIFVAKVKRTISDKSTTENSNSEQSQSARRFNIIEKFKRTRNTSENSSTRFSDKIRSIKPKSGNRESIAEKLSAKLKKKKE